MLVYRNSFSPFQKQPDFRIQSAENIFLDNTDINAALFRNDSAFDWLYSEHLQALSKIHWTPLTIARKAAAFLAEDCTTVLDIGSGIGKFCLTAAYFNPNTHFVGVEQRHELIHEAEQVKAYTRLNNIDFIHANITEIDFQEFDHFYFYNSFYENLDPKNCIDETVEVSSSLYRYYTNYLYHVLNEKPSGTRIATFQSLGHEIPISYKLANRNYDNLLEMWVKT